MGSFKWMLRADSYIYRTELKENPVFQFLKNHLVFIGFNDLLMGYFLQVDPILKPAKDQQNCNGLNLIELEVLAL